MEIRFRIDPDEARIPIRPRWRARRQLSTGWVEFLIGIDFERTTCRIGATAFDFRVVGTNLMRNLFDQPEDEEHGREPFRKTGEGRWTVLEVLVPGDRKASFLLAFDMSRGEGMITSVPGENPRVLREVLDRLFRSQTPKGLSSPQSKGSERENADSSDDPQHPLRLESGSRPHPYELGGNVARAEELLPDLDEMFDIVG